MEINPKQISLQLRIWRVSLQLKISKINHRSRNIKTGIERTCHHSIAKKNTETIEILIRNLSESKELPKAERKTGIILRIRITIGTRGTKPNIVKIEKQRKVNIGTRTNVLTERIERTRGRTGKKTIKDKKTIEGTKKIGGIGKIVDLGIIGRIKVGIIPEIERGIVETIMKKIEKEITKNTTGPGREITNNHVAELICN